MIETTVFLKNGCQFTFDGTMTISYLPHTVTITATGPRRLVEIDDRQIVAVVETEREETGK